ncbi:5-methylcytosine restriction system specificity protein McrC [Flavobacterium sp. TSSA_36]|uniref:5-methylcytosine restriction system specificity protein McrC n=1 Tax=Flavobacterium sp. TSSA_36 TaxID=3447669 RepID=UPI003F2F400F
MKASYFFKEEIKDNNYQGVLIRDRLLLEEDFNCNTYARPNKPNLRKEGIEDFLRKIKDNIQSIDISKATKHLLLEDLEFDANTDQKIIEIVGSTFENLSIKTSNIVGSFYFKGNQLNINCRFGNSFLQYMIANTSGFIELERFGGLNNDIGLGEWILIIYWKMQLKKAFSHGLYKTYIQKKESINTIKGSIDINAYIAEHYFNGKTTCLYKEHSYENHINLTIKKAIAKIGKSKYDGMLNDMLNIKSTFDGIHFKNGKTNESDKKVKNPFYKKYNEVYDLSQRIINDEFLSFGDPESEFSAFIFDISLLFEHHIRKVIKNSIVLLPKNKNEFEIPNGITTNKIFPDVIIDYGNNKIGIYDVKYKHFQTKGKEKGVQREDKFQLITYLAYYSSKYEVIDSGFIYPCRDEEFYDLTNAVKEVQFIKVGKTNNIPFNIRFYKVSEDLNFQYNFDIEFGKQFLVESNSITKD